MTSLLPTLSGILLLAALTALPASALTLEELEKSYDAKQSGIHLEKDKSLSRLNEGYLGALARIETKYQRAGHLDEVLLVKDEIKNISDGKWPLLALPKKISLEVAEPRKLYLKKRIKIEQNAARQTAETADKMLALLEKQAVNLTKKDDLQQALLARQIKADIESDTNLASARKLLVNVMTDGRSRPALRIRRYGDNIEVLVRYDMRGKVSPDSPVSNVEEKDKAIGDTSAKTLGEFVGAKGFQVDPYLAFEKTFDDKDIAGVALARIDSNFGQKIDGITGVVLSPQKEAVNLYASFPASLPPISMAGTMRLTFDYYLPKTNKAIDGFSLVQGTSGGASLGGKVFSTQGKWISEAVSFVSVNEETRLLLYFHTPPGKKHEKLHEDKIILGKIKSEQIKFSAFIVQRLGANGVITETFEDPAKQPRFATNGKPLTQ